MASEANGDPTALVSPCRYDAGSPWCAACGEDPDPGAALALAPHPECSVCDALGRCVCAPVGQGAPR